MQVPNWPAFKEALYKEIRTLLENGTFRFYLRSEVRRSRLVSAKAVIYRKLDADNNVVRYKGRIVARGFI